MADQLEQKPFVLGIDLGSNSVGWALIRLEDGKPAGIIRAGARAFDAGMKGSIESGREESRNVKRRQMRLQQRQTWRRARRLKKIFRLLQEFKLLPDGEASTPDKRQDLLEALDKNILASAWFKQKESAGSKHEARQVLPYLLRAAALDEKLEPHYLGRALYHLAQRRGFKSNRIQSSVKKKEDDEGPVKQEIKSLGNRMGEATLGQYFSGLSPFVQRIRTQKTLRDWYRKEFDLIWDKQAQHHPELQMTEKKKEELFHAIFDQRPLKDQSHLIGPCELEPGERRAPTYLLSSQRFRLLQKVNDLRVRVPEGSELELLAEDRTKLIQALEEKGNQTFVQVAKKLKLGEPEFNLQRGGEKKLPGDRTGSQFRKVFRKSWDQMTDEERDEKVSVVYDCLDDQKLVGIGEKEWSLDAKFAAKLTEIKFESSYLNLSRAAIGKLLTLMEAGFSYGSLAPFYRHLTPETTASLLSKVQEGMPPKLASQVVFAECINPAGEPKSLLPPVAMEIPWLRNPTVMRSLTELRKVVNAIIRQYGKKPEEIRIELAREMKKPKWRRKQISKRNRENETGRKQAKEEIKRETQNPYPSPYDIRKLILYKECRGQCVYCGAQISRSNLFGDNSDSEVDHIIPFSRLQEDSFTHVVLCHARCNAEKGNRTPSEAFTGEEHERILDRVSRFDNDEATRKAKLRHFTLAGEELANYLNDFSSRQLNDTAYASKLACQYLGVLYGGVEDSTGKKRVKASSGGVTGYLRRLWNLNRILNDGPTKSGGFIPKTRDDHRHHAVDAVVIGLTDESVVHKLSRAAERGFYRGRPFAPLEGLWPNFVPSIKTEIDRVVVSHRVSKKVSGALHEETIYSPSIPERGPDGKPNGEGIPHVRKPLAAITKGEIKDIADDAVRQRVQKRLQELGDGDPKKLFAIEANLPFLIAKDGRHIPIKRVRVKKKLPTFPLGSGRAERNVTTESNHHLEIFSKLDEDGNEVGWDGAVVSMLKVYSRKRLGLPIVQREHGPGTQFKFSLGAGEVVECDIAPGQRGLFVFRKVSRITATDQIQIGFAPLNDARKAKDMQTSRSWLWSGPNRLMERHARKFVVNPLGEVSEAHD